MTNRSEGEIYNAVHSKLDDIDFKILWTVDTRRDDRDAIEAAMITLVKYLDEDKATIKALWYDLGDSKTGNSEYRLVFGPYHNLLHELNQEFEDLKNNWTHHYIWTNEEDHLQRLTWRIDNAERLVLINQEVLIAKREIVRDNSYLSFIPVPGRPDRTYINTPPICNSNCNTDGENKITISDVLWKSNPGTTAWKTFILDYSECTNPELRSLWKIVVDENWKDAKWNSPQVREWVKVSSSRYMEALEEYENSLDNPLYHSGGKSVAEQLDDQYKNDVGLLEKYWVEVASNVNSFYDFLAGIEGRLPQYWDCARILYRKDSKLFKPLKALYDSWNYAQVISFLASTETILDRKIKRNKSWWFDLSALPIEKTDTFEPWIIQANFEWGKRVQKEVLFYDWKHWWNQWWCIKISPELYDFIDRYDDEVVQYLTYRIRQKRNDHKYENLEIKTDIVSETENVDKNKAEVQKNYELKSYWLDQLIWACEDFKNSSSGHQPTELTALKKYLKNLKHSLDKWFNKGKMPSAAERSKHYNEISKLWIDFKNHDWNFALFMLDATAKKYLHNILYATDKATIQTNIKDLTNGMTIWDNTAWNAAVEDATFDWLFWEWNLEVKDEEKKGLNKCISKIKKDFTVTCDDDWNITSSPKAMDKLINTRINTADLLDSKPGKSPTYNNLLNYLIKEWYLPKGTKCTWDVYNACSALSRALYEKEQLLKSDGRKLTPEMLKAKYSREKDGLLEAKSRRALTPQEEKKLDTITKLEAIGYRSSEIKSIIDEENKKIENSIKYWDMLCIFGWSIWKYFIEAWGWISWDSRTAKMLNDSYWTWWWLDFSDGTCEQIGPILTSIVEEVIICAVAMAVWTFTAWAWSAAILALNIATKSGRALRICNMCRKLVSWGKYLKRMETIVSKANTIRAASTVATEAANGWKAWRNLKYIYNLWKAATAGELWGWMRVMWTIFEWIWFHVSSTVIRNAIDNKELTEWLNLQTHWKSYIESIAFLWVLKMVSWPIGNLTKNEIEWIMKSGANKYLKGLFVTWISLPTEMLSLMATDQAISLMFDQKFKSITIEEFIHMLWMCLWLRAVWGVTKLIVKDRTKEWKYTIIKEYKDWTKEEITLNKKGEMIWEPKPIGPKRAKDKKTDEFKRAQDEAESYKKKDIKEWENEERNGETKENKEPLDWEEFKKKTREENIDPRKKTQEEKMKNFENQGKDKDSFWEKFKELMENYNEGLKDLNKRMKEYKKSLEKKAKENWKKFDKKDFEKKKNELLEEYREMYKECSKKFRENMETFKETHKKLMDEWKIDDAIEMENFIKEQYKLLLENWPSALDWLIDLKWVKGNLKWQVWRELHDSLKSILERFERGEISEQQIQTEVEKLSTNKDFMEDLSERLKLDEWKKRDHETLKKAIEEVDNALKDYYDAVKDVCDPEIEKMIRNEALWATIENWYYTKEWKYSTETKEHKQERIMDEKAMEERAVQNGNITEELTSNLLDKIDDNVISKSEKQQIKDLIKSIENGFKDEWLSNKEIYDLCKDCIEEITYQTLETQTRTMGDHGINHIAWNIARFDSYIDSWVESWLSLGEGISPQKWKLMWRIIQIFHDSWYAAYISRGSGHFDWSAIHPFTSQKCFNERVKPLLEKTGVFSPEDLDLMSRTIWSHDGTTLNWDNPITTMTHLADNMAIWVDKFQLLMTDPVTAPYLLTLMRWGKENIDYWKKILIKKINESGMPEPKKQALISAIKEYGDKSYSNFWFYSIEAGNELVIEWKRKTLVYHETQYDWIKWLELEAKIRWIKLGKWKWEIDLEWAIEEARQWNIEKLYDILKMKEFEWWWDQMTKPWWDYWERYKVRVSFGDAVEMIHGGGGKVDTNRIKAYLLAWYTVEFVTNTGEIQLWVRFDRSNNEVKTKHTNNAYDIEAAARKTNEILDKHFVEGEQRKLDIGTICQYANTLNARIDVFKNYIETKNLPEGKTIETIKEEIVKNIEVLVASSAVLGPEIKPQQEILLTFKKAIENPESQITLNDIETLNKALNENLLEHVLNVLPEPPKPQNPS